MTDQTQGRDTGEIARLVGALLIIGVMIAFVVDNVDSVKVGFIVTDKKIPLIFVLIGTALIGAILDRLVQYARRRRH
jgi:uncharacterized integral membrane protein